MKEQLNPMTFYQSKVQSFCDILNIIRTSGATGIKTVYFRCVDWNKDADITLWFKIVNNTKIQAYRVHNGKMVKVSEFHPDFRFTIADMFKEFEYIVER